jgi:hypothetical protein
MGHENFRIYFKLWAKAHNQILTHGWLFDKVYIFLCFSGLEYATSLFCCLAFVVTG